MSPIRLILLELLSSAVLFPAYHRESAGFGQSPFNYTISLDPDVTVRIGGRSRLAGNFIVRPYKVSEAELIFGVNKKKDVPHSKEMASSGGLAQQQGLAECLP
jgi:hypothetical protein